MLLSLIRTFVLYLALVITVRLMGKRQLGELEPAEFVVTMLIANLAAIPMQDSAIPLLSGLVPILTVLGVQLVLSVLSMKSITIRRWLCGKPVILMSNGKIVEKNLRRARITLDELSEHLRQKDILDFSMVKYAILETDGQLSVFLYAQYKPVPASGNAKDPSLPVTIISDGKLLKQNLPAAGRDQNWLRKELQARNATVEQTLLMTVDDENTIRWVKKEDAK